MFAGDTPIFILDGAQGTELERRGASYKTKLWSAELLAGTEEDHERIRAMHLEYLRAGADIITCASYQISYPAFQQELGLGHDQVAACCRRAVDLAAAARERFCSEQNFDAVGRSQPHTCTSADKDSTPNQPELSHPAVSGPTSMHSVSMHSEPSTTDAQTGKQPVGQAACRRPPLVVYSCGPFGASLGDGSEYSGSYSDRMSEEQLAQHHRQLLQPVLGDPRVDLLCFETIPCLKEAKAIAGLLQQLQPGKPAWISFSCKDPATTCHGESLAEEVLPALWPCSQLSAVGINCVRPPHVCPLLEAAAAKIKQLQQHQQPSGSPSSGSTRASPLQLVCYPNSGEGWDDVRRDWVSSPEAAGPDSFAALAREWVGASGGLLKVVGGCCRTTPAHVERLRAALVS